MRKKIVAGNWKMNLTKQESLKLASIFNSTYFRKDLVEVLVFPPSVYLDSLTNQNFENLVVGSQNFYPQSNGAFTGEISINHLLDLSVAAVLIGHSERRSIFFESNSFLKAKVDAAINSKLTVIFCCGEPEEIREIGGQNEFVERQLQESLLHLTAKQIEDVVVAYEPIWAIGTGKTASNEQANAMHQYIRSVFSSVYGNEVSDHIRIIYGGSCNAENAQGLFSMSDIDGGLIGGASLKEKDFITIISSAQ
jgi:triosephosphate isomerase